MVSSTTTRFSPGAVKQALPAAVSPMLLLSEKQIVSRPGWTYEPKLDGMRCIAIVTGGKCRLFSRTGRELSFVFPEIVSALTGRRQVVIDAEIIVVGEDGKPDFEALQSRWLLTKERDILNAQRRSPVAFYAFDLLHRDEHSLTRCKLSERKEQLEHGVSECETIRLVTCFEDGLKLFEVCRQQKLEGVVSKRKDSIYSPGTRSRDWIKTKFTEAGSFVVVGYKKDDGFLVATDQDGRNTVGAVKYGFTKTGYESLVSRLKAVERKTNSDVTWFEPSVWIDVEFMTWTKSGKLRFPVFKGISSTLR